MDQTLSTQSFEAGNAGLIDEIIRMSDFSFQRMPMLDIIGEHMAKNIAVTFPDLTRVLCEVSFDQLGYLPMAQVLDAIPALSILAICDGTPLSGEFMLVMDSTLVMTALELTLGGAAGEDLERNQSHFTPIELGFGRRLAQLILDELQRSLSVVCDADLSLERLETDPEAANIAQLSSLCVRLKFSVAMSGRAGSLEVVIPYDALEQIRPVLGKIHFGERAEAGNTWNTQLVSQIERANVELEAVFAEMPVPIQEIMNWKPGDTMNLLIDESSEATVVCGETPMFRVALGKRRNGNTAIQITHALEREKEADHGHDNN